MFGPAAPGRAAPGRRLRRRRLLATSSPTSSAAPAAAAARGGGTARPAPERGRDLEAEVSISFEQAIDGAQVPLTVPTSTTCPTCHGTGAKPGTSPKVCPRCQGRGIESQGQGLFSISQPCSRCGGTRHGHRGPVPDLRGLRAPRARSRGTASTSPPASARARACGWPARASPGATAARAGDLYVITHVGRRRCSSARATTSRSRSR